MIKMSINKYLNITEIGRRTKQGATAPFMCIAEDDNHYFIKGKSASLYERISEWMGAFLGKAFGLPIPDFTLVQVPENLLKLHGEEALSDLGKEPAFASKRISSSHELRYDLIKNIDETLQQDIFLFDAWVRNGDRSLTENGGNPNLLWSNKKLYVIDHNLIFDREFTMESFLLTHAFHQQRPAILQNPLKQQHYEAKMKQALNTWSKAWDALPEEWLEENDDLALFDQNEHYQQLYNDAHGQIWKRLRQ